MSYAEKMEQTPYVARVRVRDEATCIEQPGSVEADVFLDGTRVGSIVLARDEHGNLDVFGDHIEHWADDGIVRHLRDIAKQWRMAAITEAIDGIILAVVRAAKEETT